MTEIHHPLAPADATAMAAMRALLAENESPLTRATFDQLFERVPAAVGVSYAAGTVGGVPGTWCRPANARPDAALLYLHGGAYIFGSAHAYRHFVGQIAARARLTAFVADYRLAPEQPFPAAVDDARAAFRGLLDITEGAVAVAGDSAGGGLTLALLAEARAETARSGRARVVGAVFSPWTDLAFTGESITARAADDPLLTRAALEAGSTPYLNGHDPRDPLASPLYGANEAMPPIQIHVGTAEILLDDARRFAVRPGVALHVWEGLPHTFARNVLTLQAAAAALDLVAGFFAEKL